VKRICPTARVARLDRDAIRRKGALTTMLAKFRTGEIDVLVGTQMIAKGHDFPRVTLVGAVYMSAVCVLPTILAVKMNVPFYFGGTALLICVGVGLDTIGQIEAHLVSRQYEGFVRGTRIRGRLGQ